MCGVAGWAQISEQAGPPGTQLGAMGKAMEHRGPDDTGQQSWDGAGLVFRRLALLDLSGGDQPAHDSTGRFWTVFNGEIYNHRELRADLAALGHHVPGSGDSALIPYLFLQWGPAMLDRLRGMFTLAVYDTREKQLFLARDAFGIKPLYWTQHAGALLFASEIGALRAGTVGAQTVDPQALSHYLSFGYVPDPVTMWSGVHMLPAGHSLLLRSGQIQVRRWWAPEFVAAGRTDVASVVADLRARLEDSVAHHLDADVPVGAYLSSGVDSSLLVALASRQQPLDTFSIGFEGATGSLDELSAARALASHEQVITAQEYWDLLPHIVAAQEEPLADPSAPALWFLAREASATVKAVLSGEGADELFAGYPMYREPRALAPVSRLPRGWQTSLKYFASRLPDGRRGKSYLNRATTPLERRFLGNAPLFTDEAKEALLANWVGQESPWDRVRPTYARTSTLDDVARMQAVSCETWLPSSILMKADKMAMAHSLEVRVPYLDREVFELARSLPIGMRLDGRNTKVALRMAAAHHLPAEVAWRPKLGFPVPFRSWLDGPIGKQVTELFHACDDPFLDAQGLRQLLAHPERPGQQRRIWGVMVYLLWRQSQAVGAGSPGHVAPPCAQPPRR
jgi:asparagine synthase (glutamine-hydrolysing)